ncbi:MAG: phosphodiester glycosidase family protein, partial [Myxococcota bacterium]
MKRVQKRALALLALACLSLAGCRNAPTPARQVRFTEVALGVEYARVLEPASSLDDTVFEGHAFRIDLERAGVRVLPAGGPKVRREVATIVRSLHQVVAINGSFFDETEQPMGAIVDQGRVLSRRRLQPWGALVVDGNRARIVPGSELSLSPPPLLALQGQPRLVIDGQVPGLKPQVAR